MRKILFFIRYRRLSLGDLGDLSTPQNQLPAIDRKRHARPYLIPS
jgi:hypothetical protein